MYRKVRRRAVNREIQRQNAQLERDIRKIDRQLAAKKRAYDREHGKGSWSRKMAQMRREWDAELERDLDELL